MLTNYQLKGGQTLESITLMHQCCQMVYFQNKNHNLGKFWKVWQRKMFVLFLAILSILEPKGIFYVYLVHFFPILVRCTEKNLATLYCIKSQQ
jgi:hypothetical protein